METRSAVDNLYGEPGIIALRSYEEEAGKIDRALVRRYRENMDFDHGAGPVPDTFLIPCEQVRFANGEGKVRLPHTVRGKDIYVICDVGNYSCTYTMHGFENHMGPDDHFQDLKRTLSAIGGKARRITVIMPMLYASRQDKRKSRESLDCAIALQELESMGITNVMTFDMHNSAVQNAIPLTSFENLYPTYNIVKALLQDGRETFLSDKLIVISPDTGAMDRAIYYANLLRADVGVFYKRRDHRRIVGGKNPIVEHEYIGRDVEGQNVLIVDDIIASGDSVFDIVMELRKRKASKIFVAVSFALFTEGVAKCEEFYQKGYIDRVYSTSLTYLPRHIKEAPWFREVDMSSFLAKLIDTLNFTKSVAPLLDASLEMEKLL